MGLNEKPEVKAVRFGYMAPKHRTLHDKALPCMKEKVKLKLKARVKKKTKKKKSFWYPEPKNRALQDKALQCGEKKLAGRTSLPSIQSDSVRLRVDLGLKSPAVAVGCA